ncbi:unnamed protein product [Moneuplotes crassus]|uniref:Uncharacterized protein n=1 Tax=Euplotes crassus TaxID=5936 RepID=A0AAD1XJQ2_EUPCR|nr:unnamed protein product [Moneuplotes crassus]
MAIWSYRLLKEAIRHIETFFCLAMSDLNISNDLQRPIIPIKLLLSPILKILPNMTKTLTLSYFRLVGKQTIKIFRGISTLKNLKFCCCEFRKVETSSKPGREITLKEVSFESCMVECPVVLSVYDESLLGLVQILNLPWVRKKLETVFVNLDIDEEGFEEVKGFVEGNGPCDVAYRLEDFETKRVYEIGRR